MRDRIAVHARGRRWAAAWLIAASLAGAPHARASEPASLGSVPGQILVRFSPGIDARARAAVHRSLGASVLKRLGAIGYELVSAPASVLQRYRARADVLVAEPNYTGRIALSPPDACHVEPCAGATGQWHLRVTNTAFGWDAFPGTTFTAAQKLATPQVTIAVLDTKIDASHPDFANPGGTTDARAGGQLDLVNARDWVPVSRQTGSATYHGTFVAGLAAASAGNGRDVAGIGYAARVMPLTVVDGGGATDAATLAEAIVYAWQRGARVINLSLGLSADSSAVRDAIRVVTRGNDAIPPALVVAAAGNNTGSAPFYPGSYPDSLSVSGTDAADRRAGCSNYNANVSVSAPADRLIGLSPMPAGRLQAPCGTSAAAPQVSGLAALLFMQDPSRTPAQVRALIESGADDLGAPGRDDSFGHGRINVERSLRLAGASTRSVLAGVVGSNGGTSRITATASSARGVARAEIVFDRPDATPVALGTADGAFGGTTEALTGTIAVPAGLAAGSHTVWVRAHDGTAWGAASVGILSIDGRAPTITGLTVSNTVRAAGQPLVVSFGATDDVSPTVSYGVEIRNSTTNKVLHTATRFGAPIGAQRQTWMPGLDVPAGHYKIKVAVADASGNVSVAEAGSIVT